MFFQVLVQQKPKDPQDQPQPRMLIVHSSRIQDVIDDFSDSDRVLVFSEFDEKNLYMALNEE